MGRAFGLAVAYSLAHLALALACLVQWGAPEPWSRLDWFTGSYLALRVMGSLHSLASSRGVFRSKPVMREWWAINSDPQFINWVVLLMLADLTVFLDYGHWRLVPSLERPFLQALGSALYVGIAIWQMWTDAYLAGYLSKGKPEPLPMHQGPYRFVRHPRYVAAIIGKMAFALIFASLLGWITALAWGAFLLRKIEIEEAHLMTLFGRGYEAYQQRTAKLLPGIY